MLSRMITLSISIIGRLYTLLAEVIDNNNNENKQHKMYMFFNMPTQLDPVRVAYNMGKKTLK